MPLYQPNINAISAGTQSVGSGTVVFSNSNNVSFGANGSVITASIPAGAAAGSISAGTQSMALGEVVFSNSNGMSFGLSASSITASYTVPIVPAQTQFVLSNSNGISFGTNGSTVTATVQTNYLTTAMASNANTSFVGLNSALTANGVSATINSSGVSLNFPAFLSSQSNQAFSAQGGSSAFQTLVFTNSNGFSFSNTGGSIWGSYTVPSVTNSSWTVSDAATSGSVARLAFTNLNGVTLSLSTGAAGQHTIVGSHNALTSQSNQAFSAQGGSSAFQTLVFTNSNGFSFSNTGGSIWGSYTVPSTAGLVSAIKISAGASSSNVSAVTFSNGSGVSWGYDGTNITATVATNYQSQGAYLTTARASTDAIGLNTAQTNVTWTVNSSGLSLNAAGYAGTGLSLTNATATLNSAGLQLSVAAPGGGGAINVSAGTASGNLQTIVFSNSNGFTWGLNGSTVTLSFAETENVSLYALGNTTQNSSTVLNLSNLSFNGIGGLSVGFSNGSIQLSDPKPVTLSMFNAVQPISSQVANAAIGILQIEPMIVPLQFTGTVADMLFSVSMTSSATNNTSYSGSFTISHGIYTLNAGTLSIYSSASQSFSYSYTSNVSTSVLPGLRRFTIPFNVNITPGNYWTANLMSFSFGSGSITMAPVGANNQTSYVGQWGQANASSVQFNPYGGVYSTTTGAFPAAIQASEMYQGSNNLNTYGKNEPIYVLYRNISVN